MRLLREGITVEAERVYATPGGTLALKKQASEKA